MSRTRAYALVTSSNGIHIEGVPAQQYEAFRRELANALLTRCIDPDTGQNLVTRVWTREEIFAGPHMGIAPDLTLTLRDHGFFSVRRSSRIHTRRPLVIGTQHPDGVLMARGPEIQPAVRLDPAHLLDIAPLILYTLGLEIPSGLTGCVPPGLFENAHLDSRSSHHSVATAVPPASAAADAPQPEEDAEIIEKLKALGYIE